MSDAESSYQIEHDRDRNFIMSIKLPGGTPVPIDPEHDAYCEFVNWAAKQPKPVGTSYEALEPGALYTNRLSTVLSLLRATSRMVFVDWVGSGPGVSDSVRVDLHHLAIVNDSMTSGAVARFVRLHSAEPTLGPWGTMGDGLSGKPVPIFVSQGLLGAINNMLQDESSEIRCRSSWTVERTFVYFDISDFSKQPPGQQAIMINALTMLAGPQGRWLHPEKDPRGYFEQSICIGDGYIFVFTHPAAAAYFAAHLAFIVERETNPRIHFRAGIHSGPVYRFLDGPKWNYVGRGINEGARVVEAIGPNQDDVVFISGETRDQIMSAGAPMDEWDPTTEFLHNRGRRKDKHGLFRRVYEIDHSGWIGAIES